MDETDKIIEHFTKNDPKETKAMARQEDALNASVAITELQHQLGLTQRAFSKKISVPHSNISRIENSDVDSQVDYYEKLQIRRIGRSNLDLLRFN